MKLPMKLTISRAQWLRGEGSEASYLLRESDGKMCCLGFYALACGIPQDDIIFIPAPSKIDYRLVECTHINQLVTSDLENTELCCDLMNINDRISITEERREEEIITKMATINVQVEFVP
jgi:hypothetical protein